MVLRYIKQHLRFIWAQFIKKWSIIEGEIKKVLLVKVLHVFQQNPFEIFWLMYVYVYLHFDEIFQSLYV